MEKNTRKMREDGLVSGRATITSTNMDLVDNFKSLNDMNFRSIPMAPAQNLLSDEDYDKLIEENTKLAEFFLQLVKKAIIKRLRNLEFLCRVCIKYIKVG